MSKKSNYQASDIEVLEGLEPVRKRPGMYIGGTEGPQGLHHLVKEILDNCVDEAMNGYADKIWLTLHKDNSSVTIEDNGRGIPVDIHPKFKKSALELVLTTLHAGGKFSDKNYSAAGGLHGVGASVVNALSEELEATVWRDGYEHKQVFCRGKAKAALKKGEKSKKHGTRIFFKPDSEIFRAPEFDAARIEKIVQEKAFLNKGLHLTFVNEISGEKKEFCYEDGIKSFLSITLEKANLKSITGDVFSLEKDNGIKVSICFCWTESTNEKILSYVNGIFTPEGGSHAEGFKSGLSKAIRNYMSVHELAPKNLKIGGEDLREGLHAIISVQVPGSIQLQFQGQTKDKLNNPEVEEPVDSLSKNFENYLNSNPKIANQVAERIINAARARNAARVASESVSRKIGVSHRLNLPGKLADCSSNRPDRCELFIVEGDSAGGSAKQGRDRETQAVLPLRGKVLNSVAASLEKLKDNKELSDLVSVLGCGFGAGMKLDKLRYGKVVILTDADADGMHIASLLMAFFFKFMRPLIDQGHLYIAMSPLYRLRFGSGSKEEVFWVFSDQEKEAILKKKANRANLHVTRFKGLGEMNPKTLWETTLNPKTRAFLRVRVEDAVLAEKTFESLLGKESADRYQLIQEHAHRLEVDI
jgi:DNA gyrase/topoisomerase IV subunit B